MRAAVFSTVSPQFSGSPKAFDFLLELPGIAGIAGTDRTAGSATPPGLAGTRKPTAEPATGGAAAASAARFGWD